MKRPSITPLICALLLFSFTSIELSAHGSSEIGLAAARIVAGPIKWVRWLSRYDRTPPVTNAHLAGVKGRLDYYISPVQVHFESGDDASGVAETYYRLDGANWQLWEGAALALDSEGIHVLEYYSVDAAGNREPTQTMTIKVDLNAPTCTLWVTPDYLAKSTETVSICWACEDGASGSGIAGHTVQYRKSSCGEWQDWLLDTVTTCDARSNLTPNYFHYFRVRAEDNAGHVSEWSAPGRDFVYVEGLINPAFDACRWDPWVPTSDEEGRLTVRIVEETMCDRGTSCMARLSRPWPLAGVPVNSFASFYQLVQLPPMECGRNQGLTLSFWYHVLTYDKAWSIVSDGGTPDDPSDDTYGWYDTFEVRILDRDGRPLAEVLRDGYFGPHIANTLYDLGCRYYSMDLTPWAGQQIRIEFKVWNRIDRWYPTWVFVDEVKLMPSATHHHRISMPLVCKGDRVRVTSAAELPLAGQLVSVAGSGYNSEDVKFPARQ